MSGAITWEDVRDRLDARLRAVKEEIAAYPAPILGCDVQFNHLLEERAGLTRELGLLAAACTSGDSGAAEQFAARCAFLCGNGEKQQ